MNTPNKPLGEWTLRELRDCCSEFSCNECPVVNYDKNGLCSFGDCAPYKWDIFHTPAKNADNTSAETVPAPEPETDKPAKPRLAEILGVEVGEKFRIRGAKEDPIFEIDYNGHFWTIPSRQPGSTYAILNAIENPDLVIHLSRLTERELAICRAAGAKWVSRDSGVASDVELWASKPYWTGALFATGDFRVNKRLARVDASLFPSVKPGGCIAVEQATKLSEWVSVKDRLPDIGDEVILAVKVKPDSIDSRWVTKAFSCQGLLNIDDNESPELPHWEWCTEDGFVAVPDDREVTHWMPLPEPPEEDKDEQHED